MDLASDSSEPKVIAFYHPQFHETDFNNRHFGTGFTEWDLVERAKPLFAGHRQPRVSTELGRYDLSKGDVYRRQVALASEHGVGGFCFYHYWFTGGRRLLETPFRRALESDEDFPFCLMWANHDWNMVWSGDRDSKTMEMTYAAQDARDFVEDIADVLSDSRYIRIDGRPLLLVYELDNVPDLSRLLSGMRTAAREAGIGELWLAGVQIRPDSPNLNCSELDSLCEFPPHGYNSLEYYCSDELPSRLDPRFVGRMLDYRAMVVGSVQGHRLLPERKYFRTIVPDWDNTGRRTAYRDPWLFRNASPELFERWLGELLSQVVTQDLTLPYVFVNAWNEWGEGAYLEPDELYGRQLLQAVASATAGQTATTPLLKELTGALGKDRVSSLRSPRRFELMPAAPKVDEESKAATIWLDTVGSERAPIADELSVEDPQVSIQGFIVNPDLSYDPDGREPMHEVGLRGEDQSRFVAELPGESRDDVLDKHSSWLSAANTRFAGFRGELDLRHVPNGRYQVVVSQGQYSATTKQSVVVRRPSGAVSLGGDFAERRPVGFLHIQKTAGTTLCHLARQIPELRPILSHGDFLSASPSRIRDAGFLSGHFGFDFLQRHAGERFLFTTLRDPVERIVSLYWFNRSRDPRKFPIFRLCQEMTFDEFIRSDEPLVKEHIDNHMVWCLSVGRHNRNDLLPWDVPVRDQLDQAKENLGSFDAVGFSEDQDSLRSIAAELGFDDLEVVPRLNTSKRRPSLADLPSATIDVIEERCWADIDLFSYASKVHRGKVGGQPVPTQGR